MAPLLTGQQGHSPEGEMSRETYTDRDTCCDAHRERKRERGRRRGDPHPGGRQWEGRQRHRRVQAEEVKREKGPGRDAAGTLPLPGPGCPGCACVAGRGEGAARVGGPCVPGKGGCLPPHPHPRGQGHRGHRECPSIPGESQARAASMEAREGRAQGPRESRAAPAPWPWPGRAWGGLRR